jgi:thiol-disulfide isomerase/thioredoxin
MRLFLPALALLAAPVVLRAADPVPVPVTVGSAAPALKASRWLKGTPVAGFEKGKVYVVEFWATWCGPCRQTIPHLSAMAKKFEGKATFVGMSVWERGEDPVKLEAAVDTFVKEMGEKMAYNVARDTADSHMAKAWMQAANQNGIPAAFIIDQEGRIAWIGHPMADLEKTLENVISGKHDLAAAKAAAEKEAAKELRRSELVKTFGKDLNDAGKAKDYAKLLSLTDQVLAKYPDLADMVDRSRLVALLHLDEAKALAFVAAEKAKAEPDLGTVGAVIAGEPGLSKAWYERAAGLLEQELKDPEAGPGLYGYLAKAHFQAGKPAEAVAAQQKLLAAARGKASEARIQQYEADLKKYQDALKPAPKP